MAKCSSYLRCVSSLNITKLKRQAMFAKLLSLSYKSMKHSIARSIVKTASQRQITTIIVEYVASRVLYTYKIIKKYSHH